MEINLSTPALLFPAISLLMLAYTNRFLAVAALIRSLHEKYHQDRDIVLISQIRNLRYRVELIKHMQAAGISSLFFCVVCMFMLFAGMPVTAQILFAISLMMMLASLALSFAEIWISVNALNLHLADLEFKETQRRV
jgi:hypothetical protein